MCRASHLATPSMKPCLIAQHVTRTKNVTLPNKSGECNVISKCCQASNFFQPTPYPPFCQKKVLPDTNCKLPHTLSSEPPHLPHTVSHTPPAPPLSTNLSWKVLPNWLVLMASCRPNVLSLSAEGKGLTTGFCLNT